MPRNITKLPYLYRDAANYKAHSFIYLDGRLHNAAIRAIEPKLDDGDGFIPFDLQLGIAELQDQLTSFPSDDDHVFHEFDFDGIEYLDSVPEGEPTISHRDFVSAFDRCHDANGWDIEAAQERLGIGSPGDAASEPRPS